MKFTSQLLAAASGSIGGLTFSRNKGGQYTRIKAIPVNGRTNLQSRARNAMGALANRWATITSAQRTAWEAYADNVMLPDALGNMKKIPAIAHYIRSNSGRLQFLGVAGIVDDGPLTFNLGATPIYSGATATANDAGGLVLDVDVNILDAPAVIDNDSYVFLFCSKPSDLTVNTRKTPFNFVEENVLAALADQPQTLAATSNQGWAEAGGQSAFLRTCVSRSDGRLSSSALIRIITAAYTP